MDRQGEGLKECPFCGSSARMSNIGRGETRYVFCCGCRASMQSIKEWNTRPELKESEWLRLAGEAIMYAPLQTPKESNEEFIERYKRWRDNEYQQAIQSWKDSL